MPVLRTVKTYRCRSGKRFIRLYRSWHNLLDRVNGVKKSGTGEPIWQGLEVEWATFEEFREWALANGYCKVLCSLDRRDSTEHYTRRNCRWTTKYHNSMRALYGDDPFEMGGRRVFSAGGECPF
jgi:hypothetical protein